MTTNTMVAIQTITVTGSVAASVSFGTGLAGNVLPTNYTDLMIIGNVGVDTPTSAYITYGGGSGAYSDTWMSGNGSSAGSSRNTNHAYIGSFYASTVADNFELNIFNYNNSTTYKTSLCRSNAPTNLTAAWVSMSSSTNPITTITINAGGANFVVGSTFTLYGIANADIGAYATGGVITQDANYYYHAFGNSSYFTPTRNLTADILVVAGGGGGASGGGGAGGVLGFASQSLSNGTAYTCTIGGGGSAGNSASLNATNGSNSQFASLTASVGGGGGTATTGASGLSGGSGGGGGAYSGGTTTGGSPTSGQGYAGGGNGGYTSSLYPAGGGGGAGSAGTNATSSSIAGNGGSGVNTYTNATWLSAALTATGLGVNGYIAGGGGGGLYSTGGTAGTGGSGGGGAGSASGTGVAGIVNTGSGGGGGVNGSLGGIGGSGLIIVRYAK